MDEHAYCLRCPNTELQRLPESSAEMLFFACPVCHRQYAKGTGESLHDRWLSPLSIPLYSVIFEQEPVQCAPRVAGSLLRRADANTFIEVLITSIEEELQHPTQQVSEIHDAVYANEQQLRKFLAALVHELRLRRSAL
jgi:transposase-like protein